MEADRNARANGVLIELRRADGVERIEERLRMHDRAPNAGDVAAATAASPTSDTPIAASRRPAASGRSRLARARWLVEWRWSADR